MSQAPNISPLTYAPEFIEFRLTHSSAVSPARGTPFSAGWDLCSRADMTVEPGVVTRIPTGVAVQMPLGTYGRVAMRSGWALRHSMILSAGVIDLDYRDEISIVVLSTEACEIKRGDRIAQLIVERCSYAEGRMVESFSRDLGSAHGGFGSTGFR